MAIFPFTNKHGEVSASPYKYEGVGAVEENDPIKDILPDNVVYDDSAYQEWWRKQGQNESDSSTWDESQEPGKQYNRMSNDELIANADNLIANFRNPTAGSIMMGIGGLGSPAAATGLMNAGVGFAQNKSFNAHMQVIAAVYGEDVAKDAASNVYDSEGKAQLVGVSKNLLESGEYGKAVAADPSKRVASSAGPKWKEYAVAKDTAKSPFETVTDDVKATVKDLLPDLPDFDLPGLDDLFNTNEEVDTNLYQEIHQDVAQRDAQDVIQGTVAEDFVNNTLPTLEGTFSLTPQKDNKGYTIGHGLGEAAAGKDLWSKAENGQATKEEIVAKEVEFAEKMAADYKALTGQDLPAVAAPTVLGQAYNIGRLPENTINAVMKEGYNWQTAHDLFGMTNAVIDGKKVDLTKRHSDIATAMQGVQVPGEQLATTPEVDPSAGFLGTPVSDGINDEARKAVALGIGTPEQIRDVSFANMLEGVKAELSTPEYSSTPGTEYTAMEMATAQPGFDATETPSDYFAGNPGEYNFAGRPTPTATPAVGSFSKTPIDPREAMAAAGPGYTGNYLKEGDPALLGPIEEREKPSWEENLVGTQAPEAPKDEPGIFDKTLSFLDKVFSAPERAFDPSGRTPAGGLEWDQYGHATVQGGPSWAKSQFRSFGDWASAAKQAVDTGWYGAPGDNPANQGGGGEGPDATRDEVSRNAGASEGYASADTISDQASADYSDYGNWAFGGTLPEKAQGTSEGPDSHPIEGPGGPTSDSIPMAAEENAFILNAAATQAFAPEVKTMLDTTNEVSAMSNQGMLAEGGVPIKVSDGETYFSSEDADRLGRSKLEAMNNHGKTLMAAGGQPNKQNRVQGYAFGSSYEQGGTTKEAPKNPGWYEIFDLSRTIPPEGAEEFAQLAARYLNRETTDREFLMRDVKRDYNTIREFMGIDKEGETPSNMDLQPFLDEFEKRTEKGPVEDGPGKDHMRVFSDKEITDQVLKSGGPVYNTHAFIPPGQYGSTPGGYRKGGNVLDKKNEAAMKKALAKISKEVGFKLDADDPRNDYNYPLAWKTWGTDFGRSLDEESGETHFPSFTPEGQPLKYPGHPTRHKGMPEKPFSSPFFQKKKAAPKKGFLSKGLDNLQQDAVGAAKALGLVD